MPPNNALTDEEIVEADKLADAFGLDVGKCYEFTAREVAQLIAHVRQKERDAALEEAASAVKDLGDEQDMADVNECADAIRALKDQLLPTEVKNG